MWQVFLLISVAIPHEEEAAVVDFYKLGSGQRETVVLVKVREETEDGGVFVH